MLGYDQRYAYQAPPSVGVDSGVTSISLLTQTARPAGHAGEHDPRESLR
jgi:hypothetical protein